MCNRIPLTHNRGCVWHVCGEGIHIIPRIPASEYNQWTNSLQSTHISEFLAETIIWDRNSPRVRDRNSLLSKWWSYSLTFLLLLNRKQAKELWVAAGNSDVRKVKSLLARGANPNHPMYYPLRNPNHPHYPGYYPLYIACRNGHLEIVKALVEAGAGTKRWDAWGRSPVHYAAWNGHKEVLVYLIRDCKCSAGE